MDLKSHIRQIPDFPKPGILFYDISTLLIAPEPYAAAVELMAEAAAGFRPDVLVGIESRGFIFAASIALRLGLGFAMVRKPGKLPGHVVGHSYDLEYGSDTLQIAEGLIPSGARVVVVDDLIATGGSAAATAALLRKVGAEAVGAVFLVELDGLNGAASLGIPAASILSYPA